MRTMPEFLKLVLKSVQLLLCVRSTKVYNIGDYHIFDSYCLNFLINSAKAWIVNFKNGNDNNNNLSNKNYVRCVR